MSYVFEWNDETIWSPALRVGKLYVALADTVAELVAVPHGLTAMAADFYEVDRDRFVAFVDAVRAWSPVDHPVGRTLLEGFLTTSLVLLDRMGAEPDTDAAVRAGVAELAASMAR